MGGRVFFFDFGRQAFQSFMHINKSQSILVNFSAVARFPYSAVARTSAQAKLHQTDGECPEQPLGTGRAAQG